jgi:phage tail-like protein
MSERRGLPGLGVRNAIGEALPAMFQDDSLAQRLCAGLDEVLAPVPATLDSFWAYLDPMVAPLDFVEWLADWVGLELDQTWPEDRRRDLVANGIELYERRGTARGLADLIELYVGVRPTIDDGMTATWSSVPDAPLPGSEDPVLVVTLQTDDPSSIDSARLHTMVMSNKPAHVAHRIEVSGASSRPADLPPPPPAPPEVES